MFEVQGYLQAIVGADTALKAANVKLENIAKVKGGLVTVILAGDVGAINAAISAVEHEIPALLLRSSHVIARPSKDTGSLYQKDNGSSNTIEVLEDKKVEVEIPIKKEEPVTKLASSKEDLTKKDQKIKKEENKVEKDKEDKKPEDSTKK